MSSATHARQAAHPTSIEHWMTKSPVSIGHDQHLSVAHKFMREHSIRHLPVLDNGKLVGVLSQRDLFFLDPLRASTSMSIAWKTP